MTDEIWRSQTAKNVVQKYRKKFKRKKNKELNSIEDRKVNTNLCYVGRKKVLALGKFSTVAPRGQEGFAPDFGLLKYFFGESCCDKKTDKNAKRNNDIQSYLLD